MAEPHSGYGNKALLEKAFQGVLSGDSKLDHLVSAYSGYHCEVLGSGAEAVLRVAINIIVQLTRSGTFTANQAVEILLERPA